MFCHKRMVGRGGLKLPGTSSRHFPFIHQAPRVRTAGEQPSGRSASPIWRQSGITGDFRSLRYTLLPDAMDQCGGEGAMGLGAGRHTCPKQIVRRDACLGAVRTAPQG